MRYSDVSIKGGPAVSGISVTDAQGDPIKGVAAAEISIRPESTVKVTLEMCFSEVNLSGVPTFMAADPRTGKMKPVAKIVFADGSEFDPKAD